jgi:hypothetical protein
MRQVHGSKHDETAEPVWTQFSKSICETGGGRGCFGMFVHPDPAHITRLDRAEATQFSLRGISANRKRDGPNATSDHLSPTNNPNAGDGYACADADALSRVVSQASPPFRSPLCSSQSYQNRQQPLESCDDLLLPLRTPFLQTNSNRSEFKPHTQ